jgi:hypothetical protein
VFYTIYKITNKINGKIYIGKHQTKDLNDGYMGSGKLIQAAIQKYGLNNFDKEILFIFKTEREMNAKEAELVTEEFVKEDTNYNLCPGGQGGWGYLNTNSISVNTFENKEIATKASKKGNKRLKFLRDNDPDWVKSYKETQSEAEKRKYENGYKGAFFGKTHTEEWKQKHSKFMKQFLGEKNSQYDTMWIYSPEEKVSRKVPKNDPIPEGWYKGRKMKFD